MPATEQQSTQVPPQEGINIMAVPNLIDHDYLDGLNQEMTRGRMLSFDRLVAFANQAAYTQILSSYAATPAVPPCEFLSIEQSFREAADKAVSLEDDVELVEKILDFMYMQNYDDGYTAVDHLEFVEEMKLKEMGSGKRSMSEITRDHQRSRKRVRVYPLDSLRGSAAAVKGSGEYTAAFRSLVQERTSTLLMDAGLYSIADKYDIFPLKVLARIRFNNLLTSVSEDGFPLQFILAHDQAFAAAIHTVYTSTPESDRSLRHDCVLYAKEWIKRLKKQKRFNQVLKDVPNFMFDLLHGMLDPKIRPEKQ